MSKYNNAAKKDCCTIIPNILTNVPNDKNVEFCGDVNE